MPWRLLDSWLAPAPAGARADWLREHDYAHRGMHGGDVPENSPAAFAAALDAGCGIECDVRLSRDGRAIVFHDEALDRLTGAGGALAERDAAELTALTLGNSGQRVPSLRGLLAQVAGRAPLLIEVKTSRDLPVAPLCRAVRADLANYAGRHAVMSFDPRVAAWFHRHAPATIRGLVVSEQDSRAPWRDMGRHLALWRARPDFLAYDIRDLPSPFAGSQRRRGLPLLSWTVRSAPLRERAWRYADAPIAEGEGLAKPGGNA